MTCSRDDVTIDFDHHLSALALNPDHVYTELRHTCPVAWSEKHGGFWILTQFEDAEQAVRDSGAFSTQGGNTIPPPPYPDAPMINSDPPIHTRWRRALNSSLSKKVIEEKIAERVTFWTDRFIDRFIEEGSCDLVYDLAVGVPVSVAMEWLGWESREEWWRFGLAWHDLMAEPINGERWANAANCIAEFDKGIIEHVNRRRQHPTDDAISTLANLELDGELASIDDCVGLIRILVGAGVDTTTSLLSMALVHLHFFPDVREKLMSRPELWPSATEEFLRRYPPVRSLTRTCIKETNIKGQTLMPGDRMLSVISSANMDGKVFKDPLVFDIERSPNRHMSFGAGIHLCLGMHLARAEFQIVMRRFLERVPDFVIDESRLMAYDRQSTVNGWKTAPASFTPGRKMYPDDRELDSYTFEH